jgi:hypothetical protein
VQALWAAKDERIGALIAAPPAAAAAGERRAEP